MIAREGNSKYAFFRGTDWLGTPENAPTPQPAQPVPHGKGKIDYKDNLYEQQESIQRFNNDNWNQQRRQAPNKGVKIEKAY